MKRPFPLYLKIVLWFVLNLLILGLVGYLLLEGRFGLDLLVSGPVAARVSNASETIVAQLRSAPQKEWDEILAQYSQTYGVKFLLFQDDSVQIAGEPTTLTDDVKQGLRGRGGRRDRDRRMFDDNRPRRDGGDGKEHFEHEEWEHAIREGRLPLATNTPPRPPPPVRARLVARSVSPTRYWLGMPAFLGNTREDRLTYATLLIVSNNLYGGGLFFDAKPLLLCTGWALLFSTLFWFPMVRHITQALGRMTRATESIAQGRFEGRLGIKRRDELGQLAQAVDRMAERLQGFVTGQKRFLGDTAHELCTPLSRIQMAVGILEQRADPASQPYVQDLREEVQEMSELVAELLSFSKASLAAEPIKLQPVKVAEVVERAAQRESDGTARFTVQVAPELQAMGEPQLLQRAVANLMRNAVRYAGGGSVMVSAEAEAESIVVAVADSGPGVPEESLQRLFDPFFRLDNARTRETGGVGLGLTIVKTCVEACGGTVLCRNRQPSGLEVLIRLKPVSSTLHGG